MSYDALRHFADSWGLIFMGANYIVLVGWHFRPRGRWHSRDAATMIFKKDETEADHG